MRDSHYDRVERFLALDPIIQQMAEEIVKARKGGAGPYDLEDWYFIRGALGEYRARGGDIQTHIGGPAAAIRHIIKEVGI